MIADNLSTHIVDCDEVPLRFRESRSTEHRKMGRMTLELRDGKLFANGIEIIHYLSPNQKGELDGSKLREELKGKQTLNVCVCYYLLKHTELIPESWKGKRTYFWGTINSAWNLIGRELPQDPFVHFLCQEYPEPLPQYENLWRVGARSLIETRWSDNEVAAILAV